MNKNFQIIKKELNFSDKEIFIYEELLKNGRDTVNNLSKKLKLPRTTIYHNVDKLKEKGLLTIIIKGKGYFLQAMDPNVIKLILTDKRSEIAAQKEKLDLVESQLPSFINNLTLIPTEENQGNSKIMFLEGKNAVSKHYDEILKADVIRSYLNSYDILNTFPENKKRFSDAVTKQGKISKAIFVNNEYSHKLIKLHEGEQNYLYKFFPKSVTIQPLDYVIHDDAISIIQRSGKIEAIVIRNEKLVIHSRSLFDLMWDLLPEANYSDLS